MVRDRRSRQEGRRTMFHRNSWLLAGVAALLGPAIIRAADPVPEATGLAYQIVLRSRAADVTPTRTRNTQTGGGWITVEQPEPHTIVVTMGGSVVVGSDYHGSSAALDFNLEQDLDILAVRAKARPPRIGMVGRVVGTLGVTDAGKCCTKTCGTADQGPATACLAIGDKGLISINVKQSGTATGQESSINFRDGPVEAQAVVGAYRLTSSFRIAANQGKGVFNRQYAVADFDPAPQLDAFWADALRPFRAVSRRDFGFKVVLRVVEDPGS